MAMTSVWILFTVTSVLYGIIHGNINDVTGALTNGASRGIQLCISIAGPLCLWSGIGKLMVQTGFINPIRTVLMPLLNKLFPSSQKDPTLSTYLSSNFCANLFGLGNAATPMGIQSVRRMIDPCKPEYATDEMCRLVVMNTASIQLLPTTVAAVRQGAGAVAPFDILPCIWVSSILSVSVGLAAAYLFERMSRLA